MAFIAMVFAIFYGVFYLIACLFQCGKGGGLFLLNLFWAGICFYVACTTGHVGVAFCIWLFVAVLLNITVLSTMHELDTPEGRNNIKRRNKAQDDYDNKYRNYVKERKESKKGTIEFDEIKR